MPVLKQILHTCEKKEERLFRARALECATLFGDAGKYFKRKRASIHVYGKQL